MSHFFLTLNTNRHRTFFIRRTWYCLGFFLLSLSIGCSSPELKRFDAKTDRYQIKAEPRKDTASQFDFKSKRMKLSDALRLALEHNPRLKSFASRIDAASAQVIQARLWPNPTFNLGAEDGPVDNGAGFDEGKITLGLSQTLPLTGILDAQTNAAKKKRELALVNYEVQVRQLMAAVTRVFYRGVIAQRFVEISEANLSLAGQLQKRANDRVNTGAASETEKFRAEIEVAQSKVALRSALVALRTTRQRLMVLIGNTSLDIEKLLGTVPESFVALNEAQLRSSVLSSHPSMILAETSIDSAKAALIVSEKSWLPQPNIQVSLGRLREDEVNTVFEWGVSIPIPFFNRNQGGIAANRAQVRQNEQTAVSVRNQLIGRLQQALTRYKQQRQQVKDYKDRILPLSEKSLTLVRKQQNLGKLSQIDVLDAQRTVFRAKTTYLQLLQNLVSTCVEIEQLSGQPLGNFAAK